MKTEILKRKLSDRFFWVKWIILLGGISGASVGMYLTHVLLWATIPTALVSGAIYLTTLSVAEWLMFRNLD
jgi:hypothetical protein